MPAYTLKLKQSKPIAEGTMAFYFEKPVGFLFRAGQYMNLTLIEPPETDEEGNTRAFSIASAPCEKDLMIATRIRESAFKRVLKQLSPGAEVKMKGPFGSFVFHSNAGIGAAFVTGGIGVTPFRSMVVQAANEKLPHQIVLLYSNRRPEDSAFLDELGALEKKNKNYKLIGCMTAMEKSKRPWKGERGYIDGDMLRRQLKDFFGRIFYVAGPPAFVGTMQSILQQAGVADEDIRSEEFVGY